MMANWVLPREGRGKREKEKERELGTIDSYVSLSPFFTDSNVTDLDIHLVRQLVRSGNILMEMDRYLVHCRMVAFHARLDYLSQTQLREILTRRVTEFAMRLKEFNRLDPGDRDQVGERRENGALTD